MCNPSGSVNVSVVGADGYAQRNPGRSPRNPFWAGRAAVVKLRLAEGDGYSALLGYAQIVPGAFHRL